MHHAPTSAETKFLIDSSSEERLDYFLTRAMECEEIWGLSNVSGWLMRDNGGTTTLPVWNYAVMADTCAIGELSGYDADSTSLEHFVYGILPQLRDMDVSVELLATPERQGIQLTAEALFEIFERKIDSESYFPEG
jgi:hypothetical protein